MLFTSGCTISPPLQDDYVTERTLRARVIDTLGMDLERSGMGAVEPPR